MKKLNIIIAIFLMSFFTGCVTSKHPIGLENQHIKSSEWDGSWLSDDGSVTIVVIDELKGILQLAWIEEQNKSLKFESLTLQIMKGEKWLYANVLEWEGKETDGYFWVMLKKDNRKITYWIPSTTAFHDAAATKKIEAEIKEGTDKKILDDIKLLDNSEKIVTLLEKNESKFFEWKEPIILMKYN